MKMMLSTQCIIILIALPVVLGKTIPIPASAPGLRDQPLTCYNCSCFNTPCTCTTYEISSLEKTYCVIIRQRFGQDVIIDLEHIDVTSTRLNVREFPYVLVEESIAYDEKAGLWFTTPNFVIYGCNWNLCNKPELIPLLPDSFQMRLPEAWLNSSILGTGQPVRDCHECPNEPQCGTTEFLDASRCPIHPCNTTCLVLDLFDDPMYDYFCYQSFCIPPDDDQYDINQHRVEIEGIIYASQPKVVELWEIDLYCRADDCSRPEIFKELRENLIYQTGNLAALFNETHDPNIPQRRCYDCYCYDQPDCPCERTTIMPANSTYCVLTRENFGQDVWIDMAHLAQDSIRVYIREFPYLLVEESILYSEQTGRWNTRTNLVVFGCNWDYCNHPSLIPYLPNTFQMRLPEAWLNSSVLGTGQPVRDCHECPDGPQCGTTDFLDASRCPIHSCNTTCIVSDTFDDPAVDLQCYQSFCAPPDTEEYEIDKHRVEMEGILYLNKQPRQVELWEIDIYCRADDCSRPEIFNEIKSTFTTEIGDISIFDQQRPSTTSSPTITGTASVHVATSLFNLLFITILLINFH